MKKRIDVEIPNITVIEETSDVQILKHLKPGQPIYPALLAETLSISSNAVMFQFKKLVIQGEMTDLGFKRIQTPTGGARRVHLFQRIKKK